jgi:hypothetical protein
MGKREKEEQTKEEEMGLYALLHEAQNVITKAF